MDINLQSAKPPEEVTAAFDDAIKAKEDEQRYSNQAMSYSNQQIALAQGNANQILERKCLCKTSNFCRTRCNCTISCIITAVSKLSPVTHERLYLDALQGVYSHTTKILIEPF